MDSREQIRAWYASWAAVNRVTEREHRLGDAADRLRILDRLYLAVPADADGARRRSDEEGVWRRLQALRHAYRDTA